MHIFSYASYHAFSYAEFKVLRLSNVVSYLPAAIKGFLPGSIVRVGDK